ncbi:MAG: dipeptidyl-peptidase 3 family protein [Gammaproteobacteria bacterium]
MNKLTTLAALLLLVGCGPQESNPPSAEATDEPATEVADTQPEEFAVRADQFADVEVLRYRIDGFEDLTLQQKKLTYYLYEAALSGRDIIWDQNFKHNLRIRKTLATVVASYSGDRTSADYLALVDYAKRVWFSNGIHHHYSTAKMVPDISEDAFAELVRASNADLLPLADDQSVDELLVVIGPVLFDPSIAARKVNLAADADQLTTSATNYYDGVTQAEAEAFYAARIDPDDPRPVSWGLNSQLAKIDGEIVERTWKVDGMYGPAIERIVYWLEKAAGVAENEAQKAWLDKLILYYRSGDLSDYDDYNIAWVQDTDSRIDSVNGFTEVYGDPLGYRGAWESMLSIRDLDATGRIATVGANAQWFEDNSPIDDAHKKQDVVGISAKVITIVVEGGDAAPSTPIGVNLPNANWIRAEHGSKSVTLGNIIETSEIASASSGLHDEFMLTDAEQERFHEYGTLAYFLDVDLHEVIGHASGKLNPGVGTPKETLKSYSSALEEARADLVALYFMMDPKLIELGLTPSLEVGKTTYDRNIRNGMQIQLQRIKPGDNLEQAHMRNRQLIAAWAYEKGLPDNVIEKVVDNGKTYFVIRDYPALRELFGQLLNEIQRIKSEGDYVAGRDLIETYGVKVDRELHDEVLARVAPLKIAPYTGFMQPRLTPVEREGEIVDVRVEYPDDFVRQMLEFETHYSFLPVDN